MPAVPDWPRVCAVLATHNRVEATLTCVRSLIASSAPCADLQVVHVDDGSTDGTAARVIELLPDVVQLQGDGSWFWAGAMRRGLERAVADRPDYVLWLNDDVDLDHDAVGLLLRTSPDPAGRTLAAGALRQPGTETVSYSGVRARTSWRRTSFDLVAPTDTDRRADTANGNVLLVPRAVYEDVGGFDPVFTHGLADYDFGLRATRQHGCAIVVTDEFVGACARNPRTGTFRDPTLGLQDRWRAVRSPKGLPPREWAHFQRRHGGPTWPLAAASPYLHLLMRPHAGHDAT